jgi:hypothetical protein
VSGGIVRWRHYGEKIMASVRGGIAASDRERQTGEPAPEFRFTLKSRESDYVTSDEQRLAPKILRKYKLFFLTPLSDYGRIEYPTMAQGGCNVRISYRCQKIEYVYHSI